MLPFDCRKRTAFLFTFTPEISKIALSANEKNRNLSNATVKRYAGDMKSGDWSLSDSCIMFTENGYLVNGQHRLTACVETGIPFESVVVTGATRKDAYGCDRGKNRSPSDVFVIAGLADESELFGFREVTSIANQIGSETGKSKGSYSPAVVEKIIRDHMDGISFCLSIMGKSAAKPGSSLAKKRLYTAGGRAAVVLAYEAGVSEDDLKAFVSTVCNGYPEDEFASYGTKNRISVCSAYSRFAESITSSGRQSVHAIKLCTENAIFHFSKNKPARTLKPIGVYSGESSGK